MSKKLTKAQILAADDIETKDIEVPEWETEDGAFVVTLRAMNGTERDRYESSLVVQRERRDAKGNRVMTSAMNLENARAKLLAATIIDSESGELMFSQDEIGLLGTKNAAVLDRLYDEARKLSGISEGDEKELTEALGDAPSDGSITGLPLPSAAR